MFKQLIIILIGLSISIAAWSQDYTIIEKNGEKYYAHFVESGHTLYAIATLYDSDEEIIRESNHEALVEGLKVGQTIYIPVSPNFKPGNIQNPIRIENGFLIHRVLKKETLYSICKKYTVDMNDVVQLNPDSANDLKKGTELKIPVNDVNAAVKVAPPVNFEITKWKTHIVKAGETLYGVSKTYNVSIKDIHRVNNGLPEGLKAGNVINIPIEIQKEEEVDSTTVKEVIRSWDKRRQNPYRQTYNVALALPFYASALDSGRISSKEKKIQRVALDFYRGAYLASRKLEEEGLSMKVHVLDIFDDREQIKLLASDEKMHRMDLFIGPFQKQSLKKVIEIAEGSGAHVVCPTPQSGKILLSNENVSKVTPSSSTMIGEAAKFIANSSDQPNVILIKTKWVNDQRVLTVFENEYYKALGDSVLMQKRAIKVIEEEDFSLSSLKLKLSDTRKNVIVMPSEEKVAMGQFVNQISMLRNSGNTTVYLSDKWINSDYIEADIRNKFKIHFPTTSLENYSNETVKEFSKLYKDEFDAGIGKYSKLGYDVMLYYGRGLKEYGLDFPLFFEKINQADLVDAIFSFRQVGPDSGYENVGTHIVYYDDFVLKEEK